MKPEEETVETLLRRPDLLEAQLQMAYARQSNANCFDLSRVEILAHIALVQSAIDIHIKNLRAQAPKGTYWNP